MNKDFENKIKSIIDKFKNKDFNFVIDKSKILLKKNSENDFLWNIQGLSYQHKGNYTQSVVSFEKAILINSKNIASKNNLANSYKYLKDFAKAEQYFNEILDIDSNYINALINLGNLKVDLNSFDEAITYLNKALKIDKNNESIYINLANAYMGCGNFQKAKEILLTVLKMNPSLTRADKMLGDLNKNDADADQHLNQMLIKLKELNLNDEQKVSLYFAIAKNMMIKKNIKCHLNFCLMATNFKEKILTIIPKIMKHYHQVSKLTFQILNTNIKLTILIIKKLFLCLGCLDLVLLLQKILLVATQK